MGIWLYKTNTGKVVYERRKHFFNWGDLKRIVRTARRFSVSTESLFRLCVQVIADFAIVLAYHREYGADYIESSEDVEREINHSVRLMAFEMLRWSNMTQDKYFLTFITDFARMADGMARERIIPIPPPPI